MNASTAAESADGVAPREAQRNGTSVDPHAALARLVVDEIARPATPAAQALVGEIRRRHGASVAAVLYYGSCLRTRAGVGGVHDFYVLVDGYRAAYRGSPRRDGRPRGALRASALAFANRALPPNVFYLELPFEGTQLRAKYALLSVHDFERAAGPGYPHSLVWARFSQPFLLAWCRDPLAQDAVVRGATRAIRTVATRLFPLLPGAATGARMPMAFAWEHVFRETYRAELRTESRDTIARVYASAHERFDRVASLALRDLARDGQMTIDEDGAFLRLRVPAGRRLRSRVAWRVRRPLAKLLAALNLLKSAFTFGDWVPYALWKVERHTGVSLDLTARQRRHPLLLGWPVIFRLLRQRDLR